MFLDPNTFSEDGTVAINESSFSEDGSIFAYGLSKSGSDWSTIHFLNTETGIMQIYFAVLLISIIFNSIIFVYIKFLSTKSHYTIQSCDK